jgi:hypothetical protein
MDDANTYNTFNFDHTFLDIYNTTTNGLRPESLLCPSDIATQAVLISPSLTGPLGSSPTRSIVGS